METFNCTIVGPSGLIYESAIKSVTLPGTEGEFTVLAKHASLLTLLNYGIIEVDNGEELMSIVINSGFAKVKESGINILVEGAVSIKGNDENEISNALDNAKQLLSDAGTSSGTVTNLIAKIEATAQKII